MQTAALAQTASAQPLTLRQALQAALAGNAGIAVTRAGIEAADGAAQQQAGAFDAALSAQHNEARTIRPLRDSERALALQGGVDLNRQLTDSFVTQAGLSQQFGNGVVASANASQTHLRDNTLLASGVPRQNTGALTFQLRIPLLRNSGGAVSAPLRAAQAEAQAARSDLEFVAAQTVLSAATAYWDHLARTERLAIGQDSERRGTILLDELRRLIAADERPRAELQLAQASLAEKRSARIAAEQALLESRRNLGRVLGLDAPAAMAIGAPADRFPASPGESIDTVARAAQLTAGAMQARADLTALRQREEAASLRVAAARSNERPQFDVVLNASQNGLNEGGSALAASAFSRNAGPGYGVGLQFQMPLGNNAAEGLSRQQAAAAESLRVRLRELGFAVENNIVTSAWAVQRTAAQVREAESAVGSYATSLDNERTKRRLGLATLIDVLNVEDRYNNALLAAVQARQAYASAIAQFRFETAGLIERDGEQYSARIDGLFNPALK